MPVASNRRCKRSCNPCSLSSVLQFRAIFNASIRVATPELSIWVTPDKSMLTVLGCGACKRAISWSRTAGEESISRWPFNDARAPFSVSTKSIFGLSMRFLSACKGNGSSSAQFRSPHDRQPPRSTRKCCGQEHGHCRPVLVVGNSNTCAREGTDAEDLDTIRAVSCPNTGRSGQLCLDLDPIGSGSGAGTVVSYVEKPWIPRVVQLLSQEIAFGLDL